MLVLRLDRIIPALSLVLLFSFGIVQLALVGDVVRWLNTLDTQDRLSIRVGLNSSSTVLIPVLPSIVDETSNSILLWSGCGSVVDTLLLLYLISLKKKNFAVSWSFDGNTNHVWSVSVDLLCSIICFVVVARPVAVLIFTFVRFSQGVQPFKNRDLFNPNVSVYSYYFYISLIRNEYSTVEAWICNIGRYATVPSRSPLVSRCSKLKTARYFEIPIMAISLLVALCVYWKRRRVLAELGRTAPQDELAVSDDEARKETLPYLDSKEPVPEVEGTAYKNFHEADGIQLNELEGEKHELEGDGKVDDERK